MCSESITPDRLPLQIEQIGVNRLDGIAGPFEVRDLCAGINLIYGPNASGKSRTATAMQALIWPKLIPDEADLRGKLTTSNQSWNVFFTKQRREYQRNGSRIDPPDLSGIPETQHDRYLISLHQLLRSETGDFAKHIQRETAGGYDVAAARASCGLSQNAPKPSPKKPKDAYQDALGRRKQLRGQDQALQAEERQLTTLRAQLKEANAADATQYKLNYALEYVGASEQLREARDLRATFNDNIGQMTGEESEEVKRANKRLRELEERLREAEASLAIAKRNLEATGFADSLPSDAILPTLRKRLNLLVERKAVLRKEEQVIESRREGRTRARQRLSDTINDAQLQALDSSGLRTLSELRRKFADAQATADSQMELQRWVGTTQAPDDHDTVRRGVDLLFEHLRHPDQVADRVLSSRAKLTLLVAAGWIVLEAIVLAIAVAPVLAALAILAIPVVIVALRPEHRAGSPLSEAIERSYAALGLEPITDWAPDSVSSVLNRLRARLAQCDVDAEKASRWASLENRRQEAEAKSHDLAAHVQRVIDELGIDFDGESETLRRMADDLDKWRQCTDDLAEAEATAGTTRTEIKQLTGTMSASLSAHGAATISDDADADAAIQALDRRIARATQARTAMEEQQRVIATQIQPALRNCETDLGRVYQKLGLNAGDFATLQAWCEKVPACKDAQRRVEEGQTLVAAAKSRLATDPELLLLARPELEQRLAEATQQAARRAGLQEEISRISAAIDAAKCRSSLEDAIAAESQALDDLHAARTRDYAQAAGWQLSNFVQGQTRDVNRPQVFHLARELLADFTAGSFQFDMDDNNPPNFRAIDTASGKGRSLDELSSGTRVQLLMAVRLAFIETMEHGPQLPLLLDEILGNTDDVRANAIIDATIEISRRGRQVIYFTAQKDEIAKWQSRLATIAEAPPHWLINLADVRNLAASERSSGISWGVSVFEPVRIPDGTDHESARSILKVAPIDPWAANLDGVDLWYLIPDVLVLAKLRELGISNWGQFKIMRHGGISKLVPSLNEVNKRADARARALEAALEHWRIGRTAPLTPHDLESSAAVSKTFIDRVMDLAVSLKWDASNLLAALREKAVPHFGKTALEELEEYLRTNGFLTDAMPLPQSNVRTSALLAVAEDIEQGVLDGNEVDELLKSIGDDRQEDRSAA